MHSVISALTITFLAIPLTSATASDVARSQESVKLVIGGVYLVDSGVPVAAVAEMLSEMSPDGTAAWVEDKSINRTFSQLLGSSQRAVCLDGHWHTHRWTVELIASESLVTQIRGAHQLPEILSRPLSGLVSARSADTRVSQLQWQVSSAIGSCEGDQYVAACVLLKRLVNPQLRLKGYASPAEAQRAAANYRERFRVELGDVHGPDEEGVAVVDLKGELIYEAEFRTMKDAEPRLGRDRLYYLTSVTRGRLDVRRSYPQIVCHSP